MTTKKPVEKQAPDPGELPVIRLIQAHPGNCCRCENGIVTRSGLVGYLGDAALCSSCMVRGCPQLGWALVLLEQSATAIGGRWPSSSHRNELAGLLELISATADLFGPLLGSNPHLSATLDLIDRVNKFDTKPVMARGPEIDSNGPARAKK